MDGKRIAIKAPLANIQPPGSKVKCGTPQYTPPINYTVFDPPISHVGTSIGAAKGEEEEVEDVDVEGHPRQVRGFPHSQLPELRIFVWGGSCPEHTFLLLNVHMGTTDSTTGDTPLGCGWPTSHIALKSNNKLARYAFARWMAIIIIIILVIITVVVGRERNALSGEASSVSVGRFT